MSLYIPKDYRRMIGGVNLISGETNLREFDLAAARNVTYDINGSIAQRGGTEFLASIRHYDRDVLSWWKFDEIANITRRDLAGGRNNFTDTNSSVAVTTHSGWTGNALSFDQNATKYLNVSPNSFGILDGRLDFSVSFWINMASGLRGSDEYVFHTVNDPDAASPAAPQSGPGWRIWANVISTDMFIAFSVWNGSGWITLTSTGGDLGLINNDTWFHFACVKVAHPSAGILRIYKNGTKLESTGLNTVTPYYGVHNDAALDMLTVVGGQRKSGGITNPLLADVDDTMYIRREISDAEVTTLYNTGSQGGSDTFAAVNANAKAFQMIKQYKPRTGSSEVVGISGGQYMKYEVVDTAFVPVPFPDNFSGYLSDTKRADSAQLFDRLYSGNGQEANLRYEGSNNLFTMGIQGVTGLQTALATSITATTGGEIEVHANSPTDDYFYYYRLLPLRHIGGGRVVFGPPTNPWDSSGTKVDGSNNAISFTLPDYGQPIDPGFTHWGLYRAQIERLGGNPPPVAADVSLSAYDWIVDLPYVPGDSYTDIMSQATANAQNEILDQYFNLSHPPPCQILETTSLQGTDQVILAGNPLAPNSLYISDLTAGPDTYVTDEEQFVGRDSNDIITGIAKFFDNLIIFKNDRFFLGKPQIDFAGGSGTPYSLIGGNFPWSVTLSNNDVGCESNWSIQNVQNVVMWKDERGLFAIRGVDSFGNVQVQKLSNKIATLMQTIPGAQRANFLSVHLRTPERRHYRFAFAGGGAAQNSSFMIYDYDHITPDPLTEEPVGAFLPWDQVDVSFMTTVENAITGLDEVWIGDYDGNVFIQDIHGLNDENSAGAEVAIVSSFTTPPLDMNADHITKRWRMIVMEGLSAESAIGLSWKIDFGSRTGGTVSINLNEDVGIPAVFGTAIFDESQFSGSVASIATRRRLYNATGHHIQLTFENTVLSATWKIHGFVLYAVMVPSVRVRKG